MSVADYDDLKAVKCCDNQFGTADVCVHVKGVDLENLKLSWIS